MYLIAPAPSTMSAASSLGARSPVDMMASSRSNAASWRRRAGVSVRTSCSAGANFSGTQSSCRNSGTTLSPIRWGQAHPARGKTLQGLPAPRECRSSQETSASTGTRHTSPCTMGTTGHHGLPRHVHGKERTTRLEASPACCRRLTSAVKRPHEPARTLASASARSKSGPALAEALPSTPILTGRATSLELATWAGHTCSLSCMAPMRCAGPFRTSTTPHSTQPQGSWRRRGPSPSASPRMGSLIW